MRPISCVGATVSLALLGAACQEPAGPQGTRHLVSISSISVPAHAATSDTIRIAFVDGSSPCDTGLVVEARPFPAGLRFAAYSVTLADRPCPLAAVYPISKGPWVYSVVPPHAVPFTVSFAEPDAADSVLVIAP